MQRHVEGSGSRKLNCVQNVSKAKGTEGTRKFTAVVCQQGKNLTCEKPTWQ